MELLSFLKGTLRHKIAILIILSFSVVALATIIPDNTTIVGDLTLQGTNGIDVNPGSDTNADLLTVGVTGAPSLKWNESEDAFRFIKSLLIGTSASRTSTVNASSIVSNLSIKDESGTDPKGILIEKHSASDAVGGNIMIGRSRGSIASPTSVADTDLISRIVGLGYDGTDYAPAGDISILISGTPSGSSMPGAIVFRTTPNGSTTPSEAMRIVPHGGLGLKSTTVDASSVLDLGGVTRGSRPAPLMSQTQRDAIVSPANALMVFNNDYLTYDFYNGSAWISFLNTTTAQEFSSKTVSGSLKFKESGGGSNYSAFQSPASLTGDVTFTLPDGDGSSGQVLKTNGSGTLSWSDDLSSALSSSSEVTNLSLVTSVGSSALTIAVKTQAGSNASGGDPITVGVRDASGAYEQRSITGALSLVVSSGSTLGQTSNATARLFIYLIDNSGTLELAVSQTLYADNQTISTTAEGGAGAADSASVIYSTTARSNVNFRLIGTLQNTQTTAGTWASAGSNLRLVNSTADAIEPIIAKLGGSTTSVTSSVTLVEFYSAQYDTSGSLTTGASSRFTAPVTSYYSISAFIQFSGVAIGSGGIQTLSLYKNGSSFDILDRQNWSSSTLQLSLSGSTLVLLIAGEYIDLRSTNNTTTSIDGNAYLNIMRVGN